MLEGSRVAGERRHGVPGEVGDMSTEYAVKSRELPWRLIGYGLAGITLGLVMVLLPLGHFLVLATAITLIFVSAQRPHYLMLFVTMLTSSIIFIEGLPLIPIGIGSLHIPDVLLLLLAGLALRKKANEGWTRQGSTALSRPYWLFLATVVFAAFISIFQYKQDFNYVMRLFREMSYYLIYFSAITLIDDRKKLETTVKGLLLLALVVATAMLVQAWIGDAVQLMPGRVEAARTMGSEYNTARILPPGQILIFIGLLTAASVIIAGTRSAAGRLVYFGVLCLVGVAVLLTYNRNYWVAAAISMACLWVLVPWAKRMRLLALVATVAIVLVVSAAMLASRGGAGKETVEAVSVRVASLFSGEELRTSSSLEDRFIENGYALQRIKEHPFFGIGLANHYRPAVFGPDDELTYYVHNGYLWLLTDFGAAGLIFFLWFYCGSLLRYWKVWRFIEEGFLKAALAGFTVSSIGILAMAFVNPVFLQRYSIVAISLLLGLSEAIIRVDGRARRQVAARR